MRNKNNNFCDSITGQCTKKQPNMRTQLSHERGTKKNV
jgi:hypothetical protein